MQYKGLEKIEDYIKTNKGYIGYPNKDYMLEQIYSQETFLNEYYDFLRSTDSPLDILNSKINTFDILYVPYMIKNVVMDIDVTAQIGNDRTIQHYVGQEYNKETHELEPIYTYETVTDWRPENFSLEYEAPKVAFCSSGEFKKILVSKYGNMQDAYKKLKDFSYTELPQEYKFYHSEWKVPLDEEEQHAKSIKDTCNKLIDDKLMRIGDHAKDIHQKLKLNDTKSISQYNVYIPIGYIEYIYNSKTYYYIKILGNVPDPIIESTKPKCYDGPMGSGWFLFLWYLFYWIILFIAYKFIQSKFPQIAFGGWAKNTIIVLFILFALYQIFDLFSVLAKDGEVIENYETRKKSYLNELFDIHLHKIKALLLKTDRKYRGK